MTIRRWCLWHPKEGVLWWSILDKPETRSRFVDRCRYMLGKVSKLRVVRITVEWKEPKP